MAPVSRGHFYCLLGMTAGMTWAGPIEFSTGEIIAILLVLALASLVLPVLAGVVAVVLYRRRTPEVERTGRAATLEFLKWGAITFVSQFVIGWAVSGIA